jgi:hypothetical protein
MVCISNEIQILIFQQPPECVRTMHEYFTVVDSRTDRDLAGYSIGLGPLWNLLQHDSYGNCAW